MSEQKNNGQQVLEEARAAFQEARYASAAEHFNQAAALLPGNMEPAMYKIVSTFMAGERRGSRLYPVWEQIKPMLEQAAREESGVFAAAEEAKQALAICTAGVYRSCNDRQKEAYASLNKDVKLENKEFIFDEIRRVLLQADEEYKVCLQVMYAYSAFASGLPCQEQAPESFFLAVLRYIQAAVDLQNESGLDKLFPQLDLAAFACALKLGGGMEQAQAARNELLRSTLAGEAALVRWEEFAAFAHDAGISRGMVEKKVRRARFLEKLRFWKKLSPRR